LGFVLGSAAAITFALAGTTIVFVALRSEYPRLEDELRPLLISVGLFSLLTAAAGSSFYGELKERSWRRGAQAALFLVLVVVAAYFAWPRLIRD
jgi:hypothetical protein